MSRPFLFVAIFVLFSQTTFAQRVTGANTDDDDNDDPYETLSYFMSGLNYLSNNVYLGRKDTLVIPYISPYIGYHYKSGLYAKAMVSYDPGKGRIDLLTLEAGYDHSFGDHFNGGLNLDKLYYNKNTTSIRANTNGSAGLYGQYANDWLEPQVDFNADFNKKTDYVLALHLDHNFKIAGNTLNIIPTVTMNAGTQHYLDEYFINRLTKRDKTLKLKKVLGDASKFKALDYEFSTKVTYRVNKWLFTLIPTYVIPVNASTIIFPKTTFQEKLSNTFFVELDVCHR